jgi:hypothetical protein
MNFAPRIMPLDRKRTVRKPFTFLSFRMFKAFRFGEVGRDFVVDADDYSLALNSHQLCEPLVVFGGRLIHHIGTEILSLLKRMEPCRQVFRR